MKTCKVEFKATERAYGNHNYVLRVKYGFHVIGTQAPYFTITAEDTWSSGCLHNEIAQVFPELAYLIKWHLANWKKGPMHYVENAVYWAEKMFGVSEWKDSSCAPDPVEAFKSTVVFGAVEGDTMPVWQAVNAAGYDRAKERLVTLKQARAEVRVVVEAWCKARFDRLMTAFVQDMERAGLVKGD